MSTDPRPTSRWFRVNTTWSQSEWLAVLPPAQRLAWIELLAYVKAHGFDGRARSVSPVVFGRMVGIEAADVRALLRAAVADEALQIDGADWVITGWAEHQGDPTAKDRMKRYRQSRSVTGVTRNDRSVTVTETETETETEQITDTVSNETGAGAPPSFPQSASEELTAGDLMGLCRKRLYVGGRPPSGRTEGQDMNTIQTMLKRGIRPAAIADMIEAAATMRDDGRCGFADRGVSLSMGALYFKPKQSGDWTPRPFVNEAMEYWHKKQAGTRDRPGKLPPKVSDVLRLAIGG